MDWYGCIKNRTVKEISKDENKTQSFKKIIEIKIKSADVLPEELYYSKITLLYDALRTLLEIQALNKGYKIYNHECYTAFLKEILNMSREADMFNSLRKVRNGINYYGKEIVIEEAEEIIKDLKELIDVIND